MAEINAERARQKMTVAELAERAGIHPGSWPRYMKNEGQVTLGLVVRFAAALDIDVPTLHRRAEERLRQERRANSQ